MRKPVVIRKRQVYYLPWSRCQPVLTSVLPRRTKTSVPRPVLVYQRAYHQARADQQDKPEGNFAADEEHAKSLLDLP